MFFTAHVHALFGLVMVARLMTVAVAREKERRLRARGSMLAGKITAHLMSMAHAAFYLLAAGEFWWRGAPFSPMTWVGAALWLIAMLGLLALREVWTVRVFVSRRELRQTGSLYRRFRHPSYVLNIIPELAGVGLLAHAWFTVALCLPLYVALLLRSIRTEEDAVRSSFQHR